MDYKPIRFSTYQEREEYLKTNYTGLLGELAVGSLISKGFLTAPASTNYHGNYEGGLFDHSVNVALILQELTTENKLLWQDDSERAPLLIGITHDICKIDQYRPTITSGYTWDPSPVVKGHGVKSVIYAQAMGVRLNDEERACIIYHMGAFVPQDQWSDYTNAVHKYPNVAWTHHADMIASHIMEV